MRCVGYRQTWDYLDGKIGLASLREQGVAATRQLAKRQLTWLRAMKEVVEFDCLAEDLGHQVLTHLREHLPARKRAQRRPVVIRQRRATSDE
jgi:tRNA dimethylallyltransferase